MAKASWVASKQADALSELAERLATVEAKLDAVLKLVPGYKPASTPATDDEKKAK